MELESVKLFNKASNDIKYYQTQLKGEKDKLERQRGYFVDSLERAELIEDDDAVTKSKYGLEIIDKKLKEIDEKLNGMGLVQHAEDVFTESEEEINKLKVRFQNQWETIIKARIQFLQELKKLGELRKMAAGICYGTNGAASVLRRNPLQKPGISGQFELQVKLDQINDLIRMNL